MTYSPENLPKGGTLVPKHAQLFLKKLRKKIAPKKLRYYLCGEYGDESGRPHYHAALFGLGIDSSQLVNEAWGLGHTYLGDLTRESAQYVAGYVTKKMTNKNDKRLNGRHPEFARMSTKPGIGANAMIQVAKSMTSADGEILCLQNGDVPTQLKIGDKSLPLGRYLRSRLRKELGYGDTLNEENSKKFKEEMRSVYSDIVDNPFQTQESIRATIKDDILKRSEGKRVNIYAKSKIHKKRGTI